MRLNLYKEVLLAGIGQQSNFIVCAFLGRIRKTRDQSLSGVEQRNIDGAASLQAMEPEVGCGKF